jgi:Plasmid pRiA4b ORF-3-like protein
LPDVDPPMNRWARRREVPVPGRQTGPVSRAKAPRSKRKKSLRRTDLSIAPAVRDECDCPACAGDAVDQSQLPGDLLESVATLADCGNALEAELVGAAFVAMVTGAGEELAPAFIEGFIPVIEAEPTSGTLGLLMAVGSVGGEVQEQVAKAASAAAERLLAAGVPSPRWAGELAEPVRFGDCLRLHDGQRMMSVLIASCQRAGVRHAFVVTVNEQACGAAAEIHIVDADSLPEVLDGIRQTGRDAGVDIRTQTLDPAELRWWVEQALDARAVHDGGLFEDPAASMVEDDDEEGPPYHVVALLLSARLAALPPARQPAGAHGRAQGRAHADMHGAGLTDALDIRMYGAAGGPRRGLADPPFRPTSAKLPAKRKKSDGVAPIYQVKVGLRGAKPPIWRRLLVPADVSLGGLHNIIQAAFGWDGGHMHVFETPFGDFGRPDRELGHRAEGTVTLEQVAPRARNTIQYTYDFGDDWVHEIVVEQVLDRDPALAYPCCIGGRRAAPRTTAAASGDTRSWSRSWPIPGTRTTRIDWSGSGLTMRASSTRPRSTWTT